MKLVFFSPFLETSAIGRSTALVASALVDMGHEVVVVRTEHRDLLSHRSHLFSGETLPWTQDDAVLATAQNADALVYQIGDNFLFHEGCLHWMSRLPGIVCLHDFFVAHLFYGWSQGRRAEAEEIIDRWYGAGVSRDFFRATSSEGFIEMARLQAPMTEWICAQALAVISHSQWGMPRVTRSCPGPVRVVPLAYDAPGARPAGPSRSQRTLDVMTVGHVNANKRAAMVIRAIGSSALLRENVRYRLCGVVEPQIALALAQLARSQRVDLVIGGDMESDALQATMNETDVICALRWPSLEAASATAIEGMLYGKAVVVTDTGFYAEIPDGLVKKVNAQNEIPSLRQALEALLQDPEARHAMAVRGQEWAATTFTASNYARQLMDLAPAAARAGPTIRMVDRLARQLSQWGAAAELIECDDLRQPLALFDANEA